jgi:hypothetical protein
VAAYRLFRMTGSARFSYDKIGHQTTTWLEEELSMPALIEVPLDLPQVRALHASLDGRDLKERDRYEFLSSRCRYG